MLETTLATEDDLKDWDSMVSLCPYSEALHTISWRDALLSSFGQFEPLYMVAKEGGSVVALFPSFIFKPIPFYRVLLSMPWTLPGGPILLPGADPEHSVSSICQALERSSYKFSEIVITLPVDIDKSIGDALRSFGFERQYSGFTHLLDISKGFDRVWASYNKRVRGAVRKAEKTGVEVKETDSEPDLLDFYRLYIAMMQRFKSTPKPLSLMKTLQSSNIARLVCAYLNGRLIAGLLFLHFNSHVRLWCEASNREYLAYRPNNAIINYIVRWACDNGYKVVDFGASPVGNEGLVAFKEEWGASKRYFDVFVKVVSPDRKKLWEMSEPFVRRLYAGIQRFRIWLQ